MDTFKLKVFAITVMLIDHIGAIFIRNYSWFVTFRAIGRLAFPIFVFLIVEGYYHTSDIKKYLKRLGIFALISEIPYDLAFYQYHTGADAMTDIKNMFNSTKNFSTVLRNLNLDQNVFFTLFLGLLLIVIIDYIDLKFKKNDFMDLAISNALQVLITVAFCVLAYFLKTDYDIAGILMIVSFYLFRGSKIMLAISTFIIMGSLLCNFNSFRVTHDFYDIVAIVSTLAIIPIAFYNGKKGKNVKYLFYAFYPVHLFCLFLIIVLI